MSFTFSRSDLPEGFLFGASTAAYQIEGMSFGDAGPSHWDTFAAVPGNVFQAQDGAVACDHYHRYEEDLNLVRDAGFDAYRFSTSWARVMPDGRTVSEAGLDFYDRLADAICDRGLKPFLTLYHWDLPSALADIGGWTNREIPNRFADHTEAMLARIGDRMETVATINEPFCVAWLSHFIGHHAPGLRDIRAASRAMHHVMLAHGRSMEVMRAAGQKELGIVLNFTFPQAETPADQGAMHTFDGIYNRWFAEGLTKGRYPADIVDHLAPHMPERWQDDMDLISAPIDWLGVNYYTRAIIADRSDLAWPHSAEVPGPLPKTDMGWEIYPDGLAATLTRLRDEYTGDLPLYVTENGMAGADTVLDATCADPVRVAYFNDHVAACQRAIADGVPLKGYFAWSLLDNYEWAFGYDKRFGIVHVDYETQARTPKASWHAFKDALGR